MFAWDEWCRFGLRRPFSRRLIPGTGAVIEPQQRDEFVRSLGSFQADNALAASLVFFGHVFGFQHREAADLLAKMNRPALAGRYAGLFARTDLRKFLLACFREHHGQRGMLPDEAAALLESFIRTFDRHEAERVPLEGDASPTSSVSLAAFAKVTALPKKFRIVLVCKKYYYDNLSRLHDLGPRLVSAFRQPGVDCIAVDPRHEAYDFAPADLILADDRYLHSQVFRKKQADKERFREQLRGSTTRLALFELDPWATSFTDELAVPGEPYDFVWTLSPGLVRDGKINNVPACVVPFPVGFPKLFAEARARRPSSSGAPVRFCGGVEEYNSPRLLWLLARHRFRVPFDYEVTSHADDHQSVVDSLRAYLARLTASRACLNFTRRANGQSMVVGRSFDALCAGRVLIEEISDDIQHYLARDEHFLAFRTVAELQEICASLDGNPRVDDMARRAADHFETHYSDTAVLRHLLTFV
jgi:hypothetical protein